MKTDRRSVGAILVARRTQNSIEYRIQNDETEIENYFLTVT
jgi:hypothetical protein